MIKTLTLIAAATVAAPVLAQTTAPGTVGGATTPYVPAGTMPPPGRTPSGLGSPPSAVATVPTLPQPATGVTPPIGAPTAGTMGDGRVGTLAPSSATPAATPQ